MKEPSGQISNNLAIIKANKYANDLIKKSWIIKKK